MDKEEALSFEELREKLATIEHERWADWQKWVHSQAYRSAYAGNLIIPGDFVEHWERQINTPYAELSEREKQSDREQVDRYWPLVEKFIFNRLADEMAAYQKELRADYEEDIREAVVAFAEGLKTRVMPYDSDGTQWGEAERQRRLAWNNFVGQIDAELAQLQAEQPTKEETE